MKIASRIFVYAIWESEEVADARPELLHISSIVHDILAIEISDIANDILGERILAADFPALPARFCTIEGRPDDAHIAEMAVGGVKAEGAVVSLRSALVPKLDVVVAVELLLNVALRVLSIVPAERDILVKFVARADVLGG